MFKQNICAIIFGIGFKQITVFRKEIFFTAGFVFVKEKIASLRVFSVMVAL